MSARARAAWFRTRSNETLHHVLVEGGRAACHPGIKPFEGSEPRPRAELDPRSRICERCELRLRAQVMLASIKPARPVASSRRFTASKVWEMLTPLQREAILGWFAGSYAPARNAARFPLIKVAHLTHAESIIAEHWKGMEP